MCVEKPLNSQVNYDSLSSHVKIYCFLFMNKYLLFNNVLPWPQNEAKRAMVLMMSQLLSSAYS